MTWREEGRKETGRGGFQLTRINNGGGNNGQASDPPKIPQNSFLVENHFMLLGAPPKHDLLGGVINYDSQLTITPRFNHNSGLYTHTYVHTYIHTYIYTYIFLFSPHITRVTTVQASLEFLHVTSVTRVL